MENPIEIRFRGDVTEENVLDILYGDESGLKVDPDSTMRSGAGLVIFGIVIAVGQLAAALWQIHQAEVARREARAAARAAKRAARRPLQIDLHIQGTDHPIPTESQEQFVRAVEQALNPPSSPA